MAQDLYSGDCSVELEIDVVKESFITPIIVTGHRMKYSTETLSLLYEIYFTSHLVFYNTFIISDHITLKPKTKLNTLLCSLNT